VTAVTSGCSPRSLRGASSSRPFTNLSAEQAAFWQWLLSFARLQRCIRAASRAAPAKSAAYRRKAGPDRCRQRGLLTSARESRRTSADGYPSTAASSVSAAISHPGCLSFALGDACVYSPASRRCGAHGHLAVGSEYGRSATRTLPIAQHRPRLSVPIEIRPPRDTRALQACVGHKNIQHMVRYTELSPDRFKDFWR
jgi:hypothetical protein